MKPLVFFIVLIVGVIAIGIFLWQRIDLTFWNQADSNPSQEFQILPGGPVSSVEPSDEAGITVDEILDNPQVYQGLEVTVEGVVNEWVAKNAFTIGSQGLLDEGLLVIAASDFPNPENVASDQLAISDNSYVEVTGTIKIFNREQIQQELAVELEPEVFTSYENTPVILVQQVREVQ